MMAFKSEALENILNLPLDSCSCIDLTSHLVNIASQQQQSTDQNLCQLLDGKNVSSNFLSCKSAQQQRKKTFL